MLMPKIRYIDTVSGSTWIVCSVFCRTVPKLLPMIFQDGWTAMHKAILGKKQAVMNYLLRESANPFVRDKVSKTWFAVVLSLMD